MVSNEVVLNTVRRMISSGVDDGTIRSTLKGISLSEREIDDVLAEAKSGSATSRPSYPMPAVQGASQKGSDAYPQETEEVTEDDSLPADDEDQEGDDDLSDEMQSHAQEQIARHEVTQNILEGHSEKIDSLNDGVDLLHEKFDNAPRMPPVVIAKISALDARISALEKIVSETNANTIALQDILKKVLETDRKTLLELQGRK